LEEIGLDVAASAGAACHSDTVTLSHVLEAMRVPLEWAKGTVRFSTGRMTSSDDIDRAVEVVVNAVQNL
jgi:cysteine desulfurase